MTSFLDSSAALTCLLNISNNLDFDPVQLIIDLKKQQQTLGHIYIYTHTDPTGPTHSPLAP